MSVQFEGAVWSFGDHIDTDMIIPSRFLVTDDEAELGRGAFADSNPGFHSQVSKGDILVAGRNFGCGSLREHAPLAIRGAGISCIVAHSFARTFYRNCINRGFYPIELEDAATLLSQGDRLEVDVAAGKIHNLTTGKTHSFTPFPGDIQDICGRENGLLSFIQSRLDQAQ
jgi:3-isopropylmalate/(R)-2-methylmalate dehydratase small subunit